MTERRIDYRNPPLWSKPKKLARRTLEDEAEAQRRMMAKATAGGMFEIRRNFFKEKRNAKTMDGSG